MAGQNRDPSEAVAFLQALEQEPYRFDFFYALRCLECLQPEKPRVGHALHAREDVVRLGQEPSLGFAPASLSRFDLPEGKRPGRLEVRFFGLLGPNGPLPLHLTEYAVKRWAHHQDQTFARFLDMFQHRMLTLYYRAWASAEPAVSLDRPDAEGDRFSAYVGSLFGLGTPGFGDRDAMPDHVKLHFAGRLASQTRNAEGLQAIVGDVFDLPARIIEMVGGWLTIGPSFRWRLGGERSSGGSRLGRSIPLGGRVWDRQHKFRIVLGPMKRDLFRQFLPGSEQLRCLVAIVRNWVGNELDWDVQLVIDKVPPLQLGSDARLGYTVWLTTEGHDRHADDLRLQPARRARAQSSYHHAA